MDSINFLLSHRGAWDTDINQSYEPNDTVSLGPDQYFTSTRILAGQNTFSPSSTDENNPWDLLVTGNRGGINASGDNSIFVARENLSVGEISPSADNEILQYNSDATVPMNDRINFGPLMGGNSAIVYRCVLSHGGLLPENPYPVMVELTLSYLSSIGAVRIAGSELNSGAQFPTYVNTGIHGPELGNNDVTQLVTGDASTHWARDTSGRIYGRTLNDTTGLGGSDNMTAQYHSFFRRMSVATIFENEVAEDRIDPRFSNIIPLPFDLRGNGEFATGAQSQQQGVFLLSDIGEVLYTGYTGRIDQAILNQTTARLNNAFIRPTRPASLSGLRNVNTVRQLGRIFAFRSTVSGAHSWNFVMNQGQSNVLGITDSTSVASSANSTPIISPIYDGVIDMIGIRGLEHWIFGYDVNGAMVVTGSQLGGATPLRVRLPQVNVGGALADQNIVEMKADLLPNNTSVAGATAANRAMPNVLIRTNLNRVYFVGNLAMLGTNLTGVTAISTTSTNPSVAFQEVTLPANKIPVRIKWSRKAYHILFNDGTIYGGGVNSDYHLGIPVGGTTVPQPLMKVGALPYDVVDWGSFVTVHTTQAEGEFTSEVRMVTRFLTRDTAPGITNGGIYFICGGVVPVDPNDDNDTITATRSRQMLLGLGPRLSQRNTSVRNGFDPMVVRFSDGFVRTPQEVIQRDNER